MSKNSKVLVDFGTQGHFVYWIYGADDALLYVGVTSNLPLRMTTHRAEREWWSEVARIGTEQFPTRAAADAKETELIKALHPRYNRTFLPPDPDAAYKDSRIMVRLDADLRDELVATATKQDRPVSRLIRQGIVELLDRLDGADLTPEPVISPAQMKTLRRKAPGAVSSGHSFKPQKGNALKCECGIPKGKHR